MPALKCPVCDGPMRVKAAKSAKPFADCKPCGLQLLIRTNDGAERFTKRYGTSWKGIPESSPAAPTTKAAKPTTKPAAPATEPATSAAAPKKRGGFFD